MKSLSLIIVLLLASVPFVSAASDGVVIQIYIAFIAFCMLALAAVARQYNGSLYEFANMMSVSLTEKIHLQDLLERYHGNEYTSSHGTPTLFDFDNCHRRAMRSPQTATVKIFRGQ